MKALRGTGVAMVTPFLENGTIDFNSIGAIVENMVQNGIDYIVVMGTTGESVTLTSDEKKEVFNAVKATVKSRIPLVLGVGGNNTAEVKKQISNVDPAEVTAILSVSPYYNKPNQEGIFQHYKSISEVAPAPLIIYNVPGRTGSNILYSTTLRIAEECKNIAAVKEASGSIEQMMKIIGHRKEGFLVLSGDDNLTLPLIAAGGEGVISVVAQAFPGPFASMVRFALAGNFEEARKIHYKLFDITELLFADGNPGGIKAALKILGLCNETVRLPLVKINRDLYSKLENLIKGLSL